MTFGYAEATVLLFCGDFFHAPLSSGPSKGYRKQPGHKGLPERESFVHFLAPEVPDAVKDAPLLPRAGVHDTNDECDLRYLAELAETYYKEADGSERAERSRQEKKELEFAARAAAFLADAEERPQTRAQVEKRIRDAGELRTMIELEMGGKRRRQGRD